MPTEKEIEAAAKALCFANGQTECMVGDHHSGPCTPESCPFGLRDFRDEAVAALEAAEAVRSLMPEGHDKACYYCGDPCNSLAGNPAEWPIPLCHKDDPGRVKWHHTGCVMDRLVDD